MSHSLTFRRLVAHTLELGASFWPRFRTLGRLSITVSWLPWWVEQLDIALPSDRSDSSTSRLHLPVPESTCIRLARWTVTDWELNGHLGPNRPIRPTSLKTRLSCILIYQPSHPAIHTLPQGRSIFLPGSSLVQAVISIALG